MRDKQTRANVHCLIIATRKKKCIQYVYTQFVIIIIIGFHTIANPFTFSFSTSLFHLSFDDEEDTFIGCFFLCTFCSANCRYLVWNTLCKYASTVCGDKFTTELFFFLSYLFELDATKMRFLMQFIDALILIMNIVVCQSIINEKKNNVR